MNLRSNEQPGGVAERLIAPVLKTGRPKGLVSSNLTPSAISIFDFRLPISDLATTEGSTRAHNDEPRAADGTRLMCG